MYERPQEDLVLRASQLPECLSCMKANRRIRGVAVGAYEWPMDALAQSHQQVEEAGRKLGRFAPNPKVHVIEQESRHGDRSSVAELPERFCAADPLKIIAIVVGHRGPQGGGCVCSQPEKGGADVPSVDVTQARQAAKEPFGVFGAPDARKCVEGPACHPVRGVVEHLPKRLCVPRPSEKPESLDGLRPNQWPPR